MSAHQPPATRCFNVRPRYNAKATVIIAAFYRPCMNHMERRSDTDVACLHMKNDNPNCIRREDWEMRLFVAKLLHLAPFHEPGFFYYANEVSICRTRAIIYCARISQRTERILYRYTWIRNFRKSNCPFAIRRTERSSCILIDTLRTIANEVSAYVVTEIEARLRNLFEVDSLRCVSFLN